MTQYLLAYIAAGVAFIIIDLAWLGIVAKDLYAKKLGSLMATEVVVPAAALFYLLYLLGIVIFAVHPALQAGSWKIALMWGALFGFFCYMTYELTNWAVIEGWPSSLVLVDILWGVVLTASVSTVAYLVASTLS